MPEVSAASPILPVSPASPMPGSNANTAAASQGNDGQPSFSQVLRDKQSAAADANTNSSASTNANSASTSADAAKAASTQAPDKPAKTDSKTDKADDDEAVAATARTPAELAQLLSAAGMLVGANTANPQPQAGGTPSDQLAVTAAASAATATAVTAAATDASAIAAAPQADKTAASGAATAASLAANTANTTTSAEQALAATQNQSTASGGKSGQPGTNSDQQAGDKQPLLAVATTTNDKSRAEATTDDASFATALDRASQSGDVTSSAPVAANVTQTQASQAPATVHAVNTPVGRPGWADEVGQRVLWTAKSDSSRADLVLNPPQLGRIEVSIHMNGDQANASFMVANPVAREALQDAMPKLRELMSQAGIQLGQADVSAGQSGQNSAQGERRQSNGGNSSGMLGAAGAIGSTMASGWTRQGNGLVDTFA